MVVVCIIAFVYLFLARLLLFQSNGAIIEDSRLIVQPSRPVTLLCRSSRLPHWFTAGQLVSMETSSQVYQDEVNSTTQRLHIRSNDQLSVEYTCKNQERSLQSSVTLTTGKNYDSLHALPLAVCNMSSSISIYTMLIGYNC